jgi:hypothetical protein
MPNSVLYPKSLLMTSVSHSVSEAFVKFVAASRTTNVISIPPSPDPSSSSDSQGHKLYHGKFSSRLSVRYSILVCTVMQTIKPRMANTTTWRCRQCLSHGTTADFKSYAHMNSHLAKHKYDTWRCGGSSMLSRVKLYIKQPL